MKRAIISALLVFTVLVSSSAAFAMSELSDIPTVIIGGEIVHSRNEILKYVNDSARAEMRAVKQNSASGAEIIEMPGLYKLSENSIKSVINRKNSF